MESIGENTIVDIYHFMPYIFISICIILSYFFHIKKNVFNLVFAGNSYFKEHSRKSVHYQMAYAFTFSNQEFFFLYNVKKHKHGLKLQGIAKR